MWEEVADFYVTGDQNKEVKAAIRESNEAISDIQNRVSHGQEFEVAFEKVYGVKYDQKNIDSAQKAQEAYNNAVSADALKTYVGQKIEKIYANSGYGIHQTPPTPEIMASRRHSLMVELAGGKDNYYKTLKDLGVENYNNLPEEVKNRIDRQLESNIKQFVDDTAKKALNGKTLDELKQARNETSEKAFGEKGKLTQKVQDYITRNSNWATGINIGTSAVLTVLTSGMGAAVGSAGIASKAVIAGNAAINAGIEGLDTAIHHSNGDSEKSFNFLAVAVSSI